jgi:hypothetical protein
MSSFRARKGVALQTKPGGAMCKKDEHLNSSSLE